MAQQIPDNTLVVDHRHRAPVPAPPQQGMLVRNLHNSQVCNSLQIMAGPWRTAPGPDKLV